MTVNGVAYELPTWEPHMAGSGSLSLLPSVTVSDANGPGLHGTGGMDLRTTISMLPTPRATRGGSGTETMYRFGAERSDSGRPQGEVLLPSPRASEGEKGGPNMRGSKGDLMLSSAVTLFQTPSVADGTGGHERRGGKRGNELLLNGQVKALVGANTSQPSDAGSKLWEDLHLPLQSPRDATADTD